MLPISQIDKNQITQYQNNFDYSGLANYLSQFYIEDAAQQKQYLNYIRQYREQGNKINGIMSRATDEQKQALQFQMGLESNRLPQTFINENGEEVENKFTKAYVDSINRAGGEDATSLEFMLEGKVIPTRGLFGINWNKNNDIRYKDSGMDLFLKGTGYTMQDLYNMGVKVTNKDGQTILTVAKDNPNIANIFMGMQYVNTNRDIVNINSPINPDTEGEARYKIRGLDADGNAIQVGASLDFNPDSTQIAGRNDDKLPGFLRQTAIGTAEAIGRTLWQGISGIGDLFSSTQRDWEEDQFNNPKNIYTYNTETNPFYVLKTVKSITDEMMEPQNDEMTVTHNITGIAVNGAARAELERRREAGLISNEDYQKSLNTLNETYRLALNQSLVNYKVYSNIFNSDITDSDDPSLNELNTEQRIEAEERLHLEINDNNTVFFHAMVGDMIGTMVVVPAKKDEDGNAIEGTERRYFIKDFMKDEAEQAFRRDTKTRSQLELNNMQTYQYSYDIPEVGTIKEVYNDRAVLETNDGREEVIDRATALNYLNKAMVYQDAIDMANQNYWYDNGVERDYVGLKDDINKWSQLSMSELYPTAWQRYIEALQRNKVGTANLDDDTALDEQGENDRLYLRTLKNQMVAYILNAVGYNFNNNENEYRTSI